MPLPRGAAGRVDLKVNADAAAALGLGEGSFKIICGCFKICFKKQLLCLKKQLLCRCCCRAWVRGGRVDLKINPPMPPELARRISTVSVLKPRATPSYLNFIEFICNEI